MHIAQHHRPKAVKKRRQRAERDECIHIGRCAPRLSQHADVEFPSEAKDHRAAQDRLNPNAEIATPQRPRQLDFEHGKRRHGNSQQQGEIRALPRGLQLALRSRLVVLRKFAGEDLISVVDDRLMQGTLGDSGFIEYHTRAVRPEIDAGVEHPRQFLQRALVAR